MAACWKDINSFIMQPKKCEITDAALGSRCHEEAEISLVVTHHKTDGDRQALVFLAGVIIRTTYCTAYWSILKQCSSIKISTNVLCFHFILLFCGILLYIIFFSSWFGLVKIPFVLPCRIVEGWPLWSLGEKFWSSAWTQLLWTHSYCISVCQRKNDLWQAKLFCEIRVRYHWYEGHSCCAQVSQPWLLRLTKKVVI